MIDNDHNFEWTEDCATGFLKWTDFRGLSWSATTLDTLVEVRSESQSGLTFYYIVLTNKTFPAREGNFPSSSEHSKIKCFWPLHHPIFFWFSFYVNLIGTSTNRDPPNSIDALGLIFDNKRQQLTNMVHFDQILSVNNLSTVL